MITYEYIDNERTAVFMQDGLGRRRSRVGTIYNFHTAEGQRFQYVVKGGKHRGQEFPTMQECKDSLEG